MKKPKENRSDGQEKIIDNVTAGKISLNESDDCT